MNSPQEPQALPSRDLFFRLADRLQLQACVQAVEQEGKSVVLHSISPGVLDHYGQILVQRLRQQLPDTPTEIFFPTHADDLIARFNEVLQHVSVDDATHSASPGAPGKLWIVHDASALPEHEIKLLARLLQHLPGARVSAVLMLNGPAQALRGLDPQGRRLMRWEIEPPTPEQIDQMVQDARQVGREFAALELVARVLPPKAPPTMPTQAPAAPSEAPAAAQVPAPAPARSRRLWPWLVSLLALLALSVGVAAWLNPDAVRQASEQLQDWISPPTSREISGPLAQASEAEPAASAEASASEASAAAAATEASAPASAAAESASAPSDSGKAASAPAPLLTELPETALQGLAWLRKLDKDAWMLEHTRHASVQAARKQIGSGLLTNARVVPIYRQGSDVAEFAVVTGPFRTEERARLFMARNKLPASAKVHAMGSLMAITAPAATATGERTRP